MSMSLYLPQSDCNIQELKSNSIGPLLYPTKSTISLIIDGVVCI